MSGQPAELVIGCHLSTAKGFDRAVENALRLGANAFQYFPKNPRSHRIKAVDREAARPQEELARQRGVVTVAHSAYVTNLSTGDAALRETTVASIVNELEICEAFGTPWLVVHCGRHMGDGERLGVQRMVEAVDEVLRRYRGPCRLLLENTAGQGSELGRRVEELLEIHGRVEQRERVGFCLDTCHAFASGWMEPGRWERFVEEATRPEFWERVEVVHLNDSKAGCGEQVDRHALLGKGQMGELLQRFLREPAFVRRPIIIESPVEQEDDYAGEILLARRWARGEEAPGEQAAEAEQAAPAGKARRGRNVPGIQGQLTPGRGKRTGK